LANTGFQTMYRPRAYRVTLCIGNLKFGEMEFGEMKRNRSNWSNFCMLPRHAGLSASAGISCYFLKCWKWWSQ